MTTIWSGRLLTFTHGAAIITMIVGGFGQLAALAWCSLFWSYCQVVTLVGCSQIGTPLLRLHCSLQIYALRHTFWKCTY